MNHQPERLLEGALAGFLGGALGTAAMDLTQTAVRSLLELAGDAHPHERSPQKEPKQLGPENPTETAYRKTAKLVGRSPSKKEKEFGGYLVHYAFGAVAGAMYGALTSVDERWSFGKGAAFGAAVWLFGNEIGLSAAGLARSPTEFDLRTHAHALAVRGGSLKNHFAYKLFQRKMSHGDGNAREAAEAGGVVGGHGDSGAAKQPSVLRTPEPTFG